MSKVNELTKTVLGGVLSPDPLPTSMKLYKLLKMPIEESDDTCAFDAFSESERKRGPTEHQLWVSYAGVKSVGCTAPGRKQCQQ